MMTPTLRHAWIAALVAAVLATASLLALWPVTSSIAFAPDQGFNWYYWKRPDPDVISRATAWGGYVLHQLFLWGIIAWAIRNRDRLRDRGRLHVVNWVALGGTALFVTLHYLQTAMFYDGLGQDLPVIASQGSVILLLVIVLLIEAPRRGLFFGAGKGWFALARPLFIRFHGYYFAWAVTFTFWYHPMHVSWSHLTGFLYMFLLFVQAGFVFTRVHSNRWWTFGLEASVLLHGVIVALEAGQDFWPMFAFGFLFLAVVTQMHGFGLGKGMRWVIGLLVIAAVIAVYARRGWLEMAEVLRIPAIDYVLVAVIGGLVLLARGRRATWRPLHGHPQAGLLRQAQAGADPPCP